MWKLWCRHCENKSGWGWDEERGVPVNTPEIMDEYFQQNKEMKPFRFAPPPNEKLLSDVIGERVAKGEYARSIDMLLEDLAEAQLAQSLRVA